MSHQNAKNSIAKCMLDVKSHIFLQLKILTYDFFIVLNKWLKTKKPKLNKEIHEKQSTNIQPSKPTTHKYTNIQCNKPKTHNLSKEMKQTKQAKKKGAN